MKKALSQITRKEWVAFRWIETTEFGDIERMFMVDGDRTPEEAMVALEQWETMKMILAEDEVAK